MTDQTKPRKYRLSRLFKNRKIAVEPTTEQDFKWLWAAYKKGAFSNTIQPDLDRDSFVEFVIAASEIVSGLYTVFNGDMAIGLISVAAKRFGDADYGEPHIDWFPWATKRNKIEGLAKFILTYRNEYPIFIQSGEETLKFVTHIAKYGILRRVGKLDQNGVVYFFESMRDW